MPSPSPRPVQDGRNLEAAAGAVTAAQQALQAARRDLAAAILAARHNGESVQRIATRTGLDAMTVRNILAVTPAQAPDGHRT
ncbi:DNA-directed RNA polymerase specialized sigma24 family protein [Streptomyces sp. V4I23]|uniref:hypothetical protein n=1 Tax=Streptomyces sp. V4I23 TaxID=3042282 RepID=UPI0027805B74|nr:hypothetical protein [Streptomyces sp. V4I23]MDQ1005575.1 DNA-directed RNA polymerase specialized sigma24 family protein [Streptomyces sp. V4I23]